MANLLTREFFLRENDDTWMFFSSFITQEYFRAQLGSTVNSQDLDYAAERVENALGRIKKTVVSSRRSSRFFVWVEFTEWRKLSQENCECKQF